MFVCFFCFFLGTCDYFCSKLFVPFLGRPRRFSNQILGGPGLTIESQAEHPLLKLLCPCSSHCTRCHSCLLRRLRQESVELLLLMKSGQAIDLFSIGNGAKAFRVLLCTLLLVPRPIRPEAEQAPGAA